MFGYMPENVLTNTCHMKRYYLSTDKKMLIHWHCFFLLLFTPLVHTTYFLLNRIKENHDEYFKVICSSKCFGIIKKLSVVEKVVEWVFLVYFE